MALRILAFTALRMALALLSAASAAATADTFTYDALTPSDFTVGASTVSRSLSGITVTATGYSASVAVGGGSDTVAGPLPAFDIHDCTNLNPAICPDGRADGLRLSPAGLGIRDGFTRAIGMNGYLDASGRETIDLIVFAFSEPVDVGSIVVDDLANNGRSIWYAAAPGTVDLSAGLAAALAGLDVRNSSDGASDGLFSHTVDVRGARTLIVGAPFPSESYAGIAADPGQFYLVNLGDVTPAAEPATPVPVPAFGLAVFALVLLAFGWRRAPRPGARLPR